MQFPKGVKKPDSGIQARGDVGEKLCWRGYAVRTGHQLEWLNDVRGGLLWWD
jgi:hypothetical protein